MHKPKAGRLGIIDEVRHDSRRAGGLLFAKFSPKVLAEFGKRNTGGTRSGAARHFLGNQCRPRRARFAHFSVTNQRPTPGFDRAAQGLGEACQLGGISDRIVLEQGPVACMGGQQSRIFSSGAAPLPRFWWPSSAIIASRSSAAVSPGSRSISEQSAARSTSSSPVSAASQARSRSSSVGDSASAGSVRGHATHL